MSKDYKKLYEEALEIARDLHNNHALGQPQTWITCEKIFPVLRESEDERIRKAIIYGMNNLKNQNIKTFATIPIDDCLAWLEKQGEQKSWSEEDEEKRKLLISILEVNHPNGCFKVNPINTSNMEVMSTKELVNWLKSLKPNYWKPSEEQMKALNAINIFGELSYVGQGETLVKLYNDLKKL